MEVYPAPYLDEQYPLILLSGLARSSVDGDNQPTLPRNGLKIGGQQPLIEDKHAQRLLHQLQQFSPTDSAAPPKQWAHHFPPLRFQTCSREYQFPTRKSSPQATPAGSSMDQIIQPGASSELHSPLSPLSPGSPLYPDGVMTPLWMLKHRDMIAGQILSFFSLGNDKAKQTIHDNDLKAEINSINSRLDDSKYRTRYGVVIVGHESLEDNSALEERLHNIRKNVKLDSKNPSFFYVSMIEDDNDVATNLRAIFNAIWPALSEYYRDLTRHARRKRDRSNAPVSSPPATPGISQNLTRPGWNARYDYKLGVFAEYRRELDVATRHYSAALDHLFHPAGLFEVINSWSPRWNEGRLFADIIAIRFLRCQLQIGQPSSAVMFWRHYRNRIAEVLERNGKGVKNYGWRAWEARWSQIMAELTRRYVRPTSSEASQGNALDTQDSAPWTSIYLPPEKQVQTEDPIHPWDLLHHAGYWFGIALGYVRSRRRLANEIPENDRLPAGQSPAALVARRAETYDTYLCSDPDVESQGLETGESIHDLVSIRLLHEAVSSFSAQRQTRMTNIYKVALGKQLAAVHSLEEAVQILKSVWKDNAWRKANWQMLVRDLALVLHACARESHDIEAQVATLWELSDGRFPSLEGVEYDLMGIMAKVEEPDTKISLDGSRIGSFLAIHCFFEKAHGHAGERIPLRVIVQSNAGVECKPVVFSSLIVGFEGVVDRIVFNHANQPAPSTTSSSLDTRFVELEDISESLRKAAGSTFSGQSDLSVAPGQSVVLACSVVPRDAGRIACGTFLVRLQSKNARIDFTCPVNTRVSPAVSSLVPGLRSPRSPLNEIEILPKPPKLDIDLSGLEKVYYTDEAPWVPIKLQNHEDEAIRVVVELRLIGADEDGFLVRWQDGEEQYNDQPASQALLWTVGEMGAAGATERCLVMRVPAVTADTAVEVKAVYYLASDANTPVTKIATSDAIIVRPFEANYSMQPLLHPEAWPDFFGASASDEAEAAGITTRWAVSASMACFASQELVIKSVKLDVLSITADAKVAIVEPASSEDIREVRLQPKQQHSTTFVLDVQKPELDERRTIACSARLMITWQRLNAAEEANPTVTSLEVGNLGFASVEPRVLCTRLDKVAPSRQSGAIPVRFTIENPSMHYLSFNVSMGSSESFAFSGAKSVRVSLLPMSRRAFDYQVVPLAESREDADSEASEGKRILLDFSVVDAYFNKRLEVLAAGADVREEENENVSVLA